jgi:selenocysteine-specific translation elongation factor
VAGPDTCGMPNLNASVIGSPGYAKGLGKKSGETDVTTYDFKRGETTLTVVEPTRYPEKLQSLYIAAAYGEHAVLVAEKVDQYLGESILMLDAVGVMEGSIILRNYITREQLNGLIRGTMLEGYAQEEDDPVSLQDKLLSLAERQRPSQVGPGTVSLDAAFNVHGIGTVALGTVKSGSIKKHDQLKVYPGTATVEVRSIQKHDEDFDEAGVGDHVGIALKGVEAEALERGSVLTTDPALKLTTEIEAEAHLFPYFQTPLRPGAAVHLGHWLQFNGASVDSAEGDEKSPRLRLHLERPIIHPPGARAVITHLDSTRLRVAGTITLP